MKLVLPSQTHVLSFSVGVVVSSVVLGVFQYYERQRRRRKLKEELNLASLTYETSDVNRNDTDDGLLQEQLSRNISFLGKEGVERIQRSFVIIVGAGGVGSHAAHMLLRSGVGHLRLIDFDQGMDF
jgi:hypothetical protein